MKKTKLIKNYYGLEYVTVRLPIGNDGNLSPKALAKMDIEISKEILRKNIVLRGKEIKFIRKSLDLSARDLAKLMGLSHVAILKWEKGALRPLDKTNEIAFRAVISLVLNLDMKINELLAPHEGKPKIDINWRAS